MWFNVLGMGIKTAAKLYSDKQSQEVTDDQGVWSEFAEEGLLQ